MRILLVEDEPTIAAFLKRRLEEKCFVVDHESDGAQASFVARTNEYDLILLDNLLPHKSGIEILTELRARGKTTPVLVISVRGDVEVKVAMLNAGADDYLPKPFSFDELVARVGALLRRPVHVARTTHVIGPLTLNEATHEVSRDAEQIALTRKEFALLRYLMRNEGIVLSRGMLLEHVWDMDTDPFSNTVEAHIASLRKKLEREGTPKLIHTVQGRGYRIAHST
jgi:DNA-binding response OmpR family regulator